MLQSQERFLALWNAIAEDGGVARLSRLELRAIAALLPWITILEMDNDGDLRFRLGGGGLEAELGCGIRGRRVVELASNARIAEIAVAFIKQAMAHRTGLYLNGSFTSAVHPGLPLSCLGLPFIDDKSSERPGSCVFVQVWRPLDNRNRDFTNLWGKVEIAFDEIFEVHVGQPFDHEAVPADIRHLARRQGISVGRMPEKRLEGQGAD
ncbi:PAS domain-containing protein [Gimibacter soli]|uniref:PAS domain-containing protein n=1 Tax=Gimibacter soli TaxID=3024400 RepID=A0AAE9XT41_9PROT|nr:PAS domain-containing protein [Gimibacter soli]WCL53645.1 PAS domain-containing protein [Gimibacter soli]